MKEADRLKVDPGTWLPGVAWGAFLLLAWLATTWGAGVYTTAVLALVPFGLAGFVLPRARFAAIVAAVLGLALLTLAPTVLDAVGLEPGAAAGATAIACLALPLGSGIGNYRRHRATALAKGAEDNGFSSAPTKPAPSAPSAGLAGGAPVPAPSSPTKGAGRGAQRKRR